MAIAESASVEGLGLAMDAAAIGAGETLDKRAATGDFVAQSEKNGSRTTSQSRADAQVSVRKNLNETAFFFPHAVSNENGEVELTFTMPEALTEWKLMAFMHDKQVRSGFIDGKTVTSLDLMVRPNPPRFLREGDVLEFTTRLLNTGETARTGVVKLDLKNAITDESVDALLGNTSQEQIFTIPAGASSSFSWRLSVPDSAPTLVYRVTASSGDQADAEENYLPVLSRRILVTESLPLPIRDKGTKKFQFDKLIAISLSN